MGAKVHVVMIPRHTRSRSQLRRTTRAAECCRGDHVYMGATGANSVLCATRANSVLFATWARSFTLVWQREETIRFRAVTNAVQLANREGSGGDKRRSIGPPKGLRQDPN